MTESYDLNAELRTFIDSTAIADPYEIAKIFADKVPDEHLRSALSQALGQYVRVVVDRRRMQFADPSQPITQQSSRVRAVREAAWMRALAARYHVGDAGWKFLGDCEHADVLFAASERREAAKRTNYRAEQLETLAAEMAAHEKVKVVRDLPESVLERVFGDGR